MGLFSKREPREHKTPFDLSFILIITVVSIVVINILAGIIGIWYTQFQQVSQQISLGVLLLIIMAGVALAFMLVTRQWSEFTTKNLVLLMITVGLIVFLMIVFPKLYNLPQIFSTAKLELMSVLG